MQSHRALAAIMIMTIAMRIVSALQELASHEKQRSWSLYEGHSVACNETIPHVSLCALVLSHDYGHALNHDASHDVVTRDAPSSLSPSSCKHSLKDAAMQFFKKKVQNTASKGVCLKRQVAFGV